MQAATSFAYNRRINQYLNNDINQASPAQLILKVYDFAILNCQKKNMIKTNEAIQVLINSLNFDLEGARDISIGLFRLYQYCQEQTRKNNFEEAQKILTELRDTWKQALTNR
ncbi:MAG: flagellar protein FliS [Melioribacteraceae bacterium]|nr:flagellar protein FliS [Melioribacteraceae bacterium]